MKHFVARMARYSATHPWRVLALAALISMCALMAAARLPVYTSRQALLPQNTPVAQRLNDFLSKFGAATDLIVALEGAPRADLEAFASELASRLEHQPEVAYATERLDTAFFFQHAYLLVPSQQLTDLEEFLKTYPRRKPESLQTALQKAGDASNSATPRPSMDISLQQASLGIKVARAVLAEWQRWLQADEQPMTLDGSGVLTAAGAKELGSGYFESHDGRMLFMFVHPRSASEAFESLAPFNERVQTEADALAAEYRHAGRAAPQVTLTGMPAIEYEEYIDIERDIKLVIWTAIGLIAGLILLVVRSVRWALAIFIPMGLGALWSLGLALVTVGHLTIITSSFLAILFGLGADYGIFTSSQIAEARRKDMPLIDAIAEGIGRSFSAVMTAGVASLLIFGVLSTVEFPGFAELGLVAAGGVLLILVSTWSVQPAIYALFPPALKADASSSMPTTRTLPAAFSKRTAMILVSLAVMTGVLGLRAGVSIPFDYDVLSLLPRDSKAAQYQRRMADETDYQSEVIIFTANDLDELRRITSAASQQPTIARVQSLIQLFPEDAEARVERALRIAKFSERPVFREQLAHWAREGLSPPAFQTVQDHLAKALIRLDEAQEQAFSAGHADLVAELEGLRSDVEALSARLKAQPAHARQRSEAFLRAGLAAAQNGLQHLTAWRQAEVLTPQSLPPRLRDRFVSADGTLAAYAFPAKSVYDAENLDQLMREVYAVSLKATGFPTTHQAFSKTVVESFSQGTLLAVWVCLIWLALVLRSIKGFILASLPLLIGGGWMLGLMALGGLSYNFANIIALPLVIALAVDYGVWFSHRWLEMKHASPFEVTLDAGKVIALAAGTELAGLGAITLASYRGVSGLGVDITLGLLACLAATLLVAPAIGQLLDGRRQPG